MHGKLVLSPEYFIEAISDLVLQTFLKNQINHFLRARGVVAMQRVREQRPILASLSVLKNIFSYYHCSQVLVLTKEELLDSTCVCN